MRVKPDQHVFGSTFTESDPEAQRIQRTVGAKKANTGVDAMPLRTFNRGIVPEQDLALCTRKDGGRGMGKP